MGKDDRVMYVLWFVLVCVGTVGIAMALNWVADLLTTIPDSGRIIFLVPPCEEATKWLGVFCFLAFVVNKHNYGIARSGLYCGLAIGLTFAIVETAEYTIYGDITLLDRMPANIMHLVTGSLAGLAVEGILEGRMWLLWGYPIAFIFHAIFNASSFDGVSLDSWMIVATGLPLFLIIWITNRQTMKEDRYGRNKVSGTG